MSRRKKVKLYHTTGMGTECRLWVTPVPPDRVRIEKMQRKPPTKQNFRRSRVMDGEVIPFDSLDVDASYEDVFGGEGS